MTNNPDNLPVTYEQRWEELTSQFKGQEQSASATFLSTKGGVFRVGDVVLGSQLAVVIADSIWENVLYTGKYEADRQNNPLCYAFGRSKAEMTPMVEVMDQYPDVYVPQADNCEACPFNKFGSAEKGRGKACQNRRRLALIPAGVYDAEGLGLYNEPSHFASADFQTLKLPVTSVKMWQKYVDLLASTVRRPPFGVVTRVFLTPDADDQFHINFELIEELDNELIDTIYSRHTAIAPTMARGYTPHDEERQERESGTKGMVRR